MNWVLFIILAIIIVVLEVASQYMRNKKTNQKIQESKNVNADETNTATEQEEQVSVSDYNSYKKKYLFTKMNFTFISSYRK